MQLEFSHGGIFNQGATFFFLGGAELADMAHREKQREKRVHDEEINKYVHVAFEKQQPRSGGGGGVIDDPRQPRAQIFKAILFSQFNELCLVGLPHLIVHTPHLFGS